MSTQRVAQDTDPDGEAYDWSDGMTLIGPAHLIENNTVINPTDIGIVHFGGRNMVIRNNTIILRKGIMVPLRNCSASLVVWDQW